jgi:acetyl-CoA carboxylase carboxyl transferase subunit beta
MVDMVVHRHDMRATLARLCRLLTKSPAPEPLAKPAVQVSVTPAQIVTAPDTVPAAPHA